VITDRFSAATFLAVLCFCFAEPYPVWPSVQSDPRLEIVTQPSGGFHATATLYIAAPPSAVRAVLTEYEAWPALFNGRFRIIQLQRRVDRVVTDLMIRRSPLPGELRLLCESREMPDGSLITTLLAGDFKRYVRRWTFHADAEGRATPGGRVGTRAVMDLSLELQTILPDWIVVYNMRRELLDHFRILREKALAKAGLPAP
jgi:hypothetical protein